MAMKNLWEVNWQSVWIQVAKKGSILEALGLNSSLLIAVNFMVEYLEGKLC